MVLCIRHLFLVATDLTFASVLFCALYGLGCLCLGGLVGYVVFLSSFGVMKRMKSDIDQKVSTIRSLVSTSTVGGKLVGKLEEAGVGAQGVHRSPETEGGLILKQGCSSRITEAHFPVAEEKYPKAMQILAENQLFLKGRSQKLTKNPLVKIWAEETESLKEYEEKALKKKNGFLTPAVLVALCWAQVNIMWPHLEKHLTTLPKSQNWQERKAKHVPSYTRSS